MNKILLGGIVTVATGLIIIATAWNFSAVAEMPEKYVTKEDNSTAHDRIEDKLDKITLLLMGGDR